MRALAEYQLADWAKAEPLVHGFKRIRNVAVERTFRSMHARGYDRFMAELAALQPQTLAICVAYNTPWVVDVTTQLTRRNLVGTLIVCDNSRIRAARVENERICKERGVPYLPLPINLERHPCRHHGIALNWVYYNVVDRVRPRVFGFLDHDLFAIERFDLAALVANEPIYGVFKTSPWGWNCGPDSASTTAPQSPTSFPTSTMTCPVASTPADATGRKSIVTLIVRACDLRPPGRQRFTCRAMAKNWLWSSSTIASSMSAARAFGTRRTART